MANNRIGNLANLIRGNVDKLYTNTYFTQPTNARDLTNLKKDISDKINAITTNNMDSVGLANISKLYSKYRSLNTDNGVMRAVEDIFSDKANMDDIMQAYLENKWLKDLDNEIDTICKYMPKLLEALDTRKDNVLSADHFSKDFISVANSSTINDTTFSERIESIKDKYDLLSEVDQWYDTAAKYGEQFLYIVPYTRALEKLQQAPTVHNAAVMSESGNIVIKENFDPSLVNAVLQSANIENKGLKLELRTSGIIESAIKERSAASRKLRAISEQSLCLEYKNYIMEQALKEAKEKDIGLTDIEGDAGDNNEDKILGKKKRSLDSTINPEDLKVPDHLTQDGLINPLNPGKGTGSTTKLNVPGCIIKKLDRSLVKPIYMEDICMGYYYIELRAGEDMNFEPNGSILDPTRNLSKTQMQRAAIDNKENVMLRNIASQISGFVDTKFINNNIDLTKEIYMILKYNDLYNNPDATMRITYIPPEDMVHIKFREDPKTHRGISDLDRALFPGKLYSCLYITNTIANMTRSYDKRVYYVKQTIDNNIAKTLLTTINQIKKSNFGLRQIENINNVLNITGAFNDYLIPTNSSNEPPINFEIMQGQQINTPVDLMTTLEEVAINSTDVPIELIQARASMDYAVQYTMTNSKFLRKVYNRQGKYQKFLSDIVSKIYNYEYGEDVVLKVTLPPPVFLNITNTSQIINNTNEFSENIANIRMANEQDDNVKLLFARGVKEYYLGSYLDLSALQKIEDKARQDAAKDRPAPEA